MVTAARTRNGRGRNGAKELSEALKDGAQEPIALTIPPPNFRVAEFQIIGTTPYVQHKFSEKARKQIHDTQAAGSTSRSRKVRQAKNFEEEFQQAQHVAEDGWNGIPASGFRQAMISACRLVGFQMTRAKQAIFIEAEGLDRDEGTALVQIIAADPKDPHQVEHYVRNETGVVDLRNRPMWKPGWTAKIRVRFDADLFTLQDVANLLARAGQQVGIGDGRPDSPRSAGMDWGQWRLAMQPETTELVDEGLKGGLEE